MQLSPHFTIEEMTRSQTALRRGIDNMPGPAARAALAALCGAVLEPLRDHFGPVRISSGYRGPALNAAIGGARGSQHQLGEAADLTVPGVSNLTVCQWLMRSLRYDQLIYEFGEAGWVHVSWRAARLRNEELTARRVGGRVKYLPGIMA